jgi:hypothetical protein
MGSMAKMSVRQELEVATAGVKATEAAFEEAKRAFQEAWDRRLLADLASKKGGQYGNASEWRAAQDEILFALVQETECGAALGAAEEAAAAARRALKSAEIRNEAMNARAITEKLGRLGDQVMAEFEKLAQVQGDSRLLGGRRGQSVGFALESWIGMLAFKAKLAKIPTNVKKDGRGRGFEAFPALAEAMLMESLTAGSHGEHPALAVLRRMRAAEGVTVAVEAPGPSLMQIAEALDQLPDPPEDSEAEAGEVIPPPKPAIGLTNGKTDYSDIGPEEPS